MHIAVGNFKTMKIMNLASDISPMLQVKYETVINKKIIIMLKLYSSECIWMSYERCWSAEEARSFHRLQ